MRVLPSLVTRLGSRSTLSQNCQLTLAVREFPTSGEIPGPAYSLLAAILSVVLVHMYRHMLSIVLLW